MMHCIHFIQNILHIKLATSTGFILYYLFVVQQFQITSKIEQT